MGSGSQEMHGRYAFRLRSVTARELVYVSPWPGGDRRATGLKSADIRCTASSEPSACGTPWPPGKKDLSFWLKEY